MKSILTLLIFLLFNHAILANPSIKKVEELVRKRDRSEAIKHLLDSIEKAKGKPKEQAMLVEKLRTVSEMFFSDEGQKAYESALSLSFYSIKESKAKAEEALKLEPFNVLILKLLVNLEFKALSCEGARSRLLEIPAHILTEGELAYQSSLGFYCDPEAKLMSKDKRLDFPKKAFFQAIDSFRAKDLEKAKSFMTQSFDKDPQFPEVYFWSWKFDEKNVEMGEKYVQLCKTPDVKLLRKYKDFPFLCNRIGEMANFEVKDEI